MKEMFGLTPKEIYPWTPKETFPWTAKNGDAFRLVKLQAGPMILEEKNLGEWREVPRHYSWQVITTALSNSLKKEQDFEDVE